MGRELYNAPKIIIKLNEGEYKKDGNKITTHKNFTVQSMKYDEKEAIYTVFTIVDDISDKLIVELLKENDDLKNIVTIERIANILISRLRKFLRTMNEQEVLELVKDIPSLKKMRVAEKKILSKTVIKFLV